MKIVVENGNDVQILQSHTAGELYVKMKDIYAPSIWHVDTLIEIREHYKGLSDFDKILKKFSLDISAYMSEQKNDNIRRNLEDALLNKTRTL